MWLFSLTVFSCGVFLSTIFFSCLFINHTVPFCKTRSLSDLMMSVMNIHFMEKHWQKFSFSKFHHFVSKLGFLLKYWYLSRTITFSQASLLQATDSDKGVGSTVLYRLYAGNTTLFMVAENGTVSTKALWIDNNNNGTYSFTVEAYNTEPLQKCKAPDPCTNGTQRVTIHLQVNLINLRVLLQLFGSLKGILVWSCLSIPLSVCLSITFSCWDSDSYIAQKVCRIFLRHTLW